ncbi:helix-turn-helix transcriptional regulator [Amycolatopsis mongoliensis]|uniref:Helix-turn-helix transcriptional regulator n=1 Tax=Amycolatopsis mongoliensis TaxID=715475 RepID=A0A9Y2JZK0_9PSEU|nr:helix-turn-helix transcriptional regulator [Amycolatopsis sp. 4-36]WIY07580.1 helix-turn-helix transcriptional regulator [Amycolatopsis sp. 4-36]
MESAGRAHGDSIEVVPVEIVKKIFPARPSAVAGIREFVQLCLTDAPLAEAEEREVGNTILRALLAAAGPSGMLEVSCRKYPQRVEFDVLPSRAEEPPPAPSRPAGPDTPAASFAEWLAEALRGRGITKEAAAAELGVSAKTMSRWLGGQTEPRLRDLRRIEDRFGDVRLR